MVEVLCSAPLLCRGENHYDPNSPAFKQCRTNQRQHIGKKKGQYNSMVKALAEITDLKRIISKRKIFDAHCQKYRGAIEYMKKIY